MRVKKNIFHFKEYFPQTHFALSGLSQNTRISTIVSLYSKGVITGYLLCSMHKIRLGEKPDQQNHVCSEH